MKYKSSSRSLFLLMGLIILTLIIPSAVSALSPTAHFTANTRQGTAPLTVQFTDTSEASGTASYKWEFRNEGIITSTSTAKNPSITYTLNGNKTVKLTVTNASGSDSEIKTNYIKVSAPSITVTSPNGGETWQRGTSHTVTWSYTGSPGSMVKIVLLKGGTEVGTIKDSWSIGSGGKGSYTWPVYLSGTTGSDYKVSVQSISQSAIKDTSNNYFTLNSGTSAPVIDTPPTAQFSANTVQGNAPLTVQFTDQSVPTGTTTYQWDTNNDGVVDSTTQNPLRTYQTAGTYTVKLTVTNAKGSDSEIKTNYIKVSAPVIDTLPADETIGAESNPTGDPIGGGAGYRDIILPGNPKIKYTVTNYAEFASALTKTYMKGDIIYVPETASIEMTGHPGVVIPKNVTIASNRGSNGSPGGRFFWLSSSSDSASGYITGTMFYLPNDNVRITGLRLEGPHMTTDTSMGDGKVRSAMDLRNAKGLEVDNCEMYGWSYAAVDIETSTGQDALYALGLNSAEIGSAIANIHHNSIHHCQMGSLGYGVVITRGTALVKANLFDYTRHAIAASGLQYEGYEASYNIHLGHGLVGSVFDMHGQDVAGFEKRVAGSLTKIHHNTLYYTLDYSIGVRGTPIVHEYIYNNKMLWYTSGGKEYPPVYQSCMGTTNVTMKNNIIGGVFYPGEVIRRFTSC